VPDDEELVRRLRAVPANTASLRAERKRISKEVAALDRTALLSLAEHLIEAQIPRFVAFACYIAGPAWRGDRIPHSVIREWARSPDWCRRRAALVSTVPLNSRAQGGTGDTKRTLDICNLLVADRHDLVVKALSWALRELAKREPEAVRIFLSDHREKLAARVVREVNNKLATGLKNPAGSR
jgi:DNA alkylation repair enzyme